MELNQVVDRLNIYFTSKDTGISFDNDTSLFDSGIIDSFGLIEFIIFLEKEFTISIDILDLDDKDLSSIQCISSYIYKRL
jgi:acyl carrier protein